MDFIDQLQQFVKKISGFKDSITTEEATKTSVILPFFHLLALTLTQQAMIDEHTGQAITDRPLHQGRRHGRPHRVCPGICSRCRHQAR